MSSGWLELTAADRQAVRTVAAAMVRRTAAQDHRGAHRMGRMVLARFGERGVALLMATWAQTVVQHAPAPVRNAFDRVQPQLILSEAQLASVVLAARAGWSGTSVRVPATAEEHYSHLGGYLTAVQRQDTEGANRLVRRLAQGHPTDAPVLYEALRVVAAMSLPAAPAREGR